MVETMLIASEEYRLNREARDDRGNRLLYGPAPFLLSESGVYSFAFFDFFYFWLKHFVLALVKTK